MRETHRRCAFPINELKINAAIQGLIAIGVTLWQLDDPGRLWPWFTLGWACATAYLNAVTEIQEGTIRSSLAFAAAPGVPLAWAGWSVQSLGYIVLGWICIASAGFLAVAVIVRCILAAWPRNSSR